ncbi:hypothetical protein ACOSQ2_022266 [Xanthoceras sorbifolium]
MQYNKVFRLKSIKNDKHKSTATHNNDACDWRFHASRLTNGVTFVVENIHGRHVLCRRLPENNKADFQWIVTVMSLKILANTNIKAKIMNNELQDKYSLRCDT